MLRSNREALRMNMECHFGLLDILVEKKVLSEEQRSSILCLSPVSKQNIELLDNLLLHRERVQYFEVFFDAMCTTGQGHLVKYVLEGQSNGKYSMFANLQHTLYLLIHYFSTRKIFAHMFNYNAFVVGLLLN